MADRTSNLIYVVFIDGGRETVAENDIEDVHTPSGSIRISTQDGDEFILFTDREAAGRAAMERWEDMAENDPKEVVELISAEVLIAWALGKSAGPGSGMANSFQEWLEDVVAEHPEEEFASYDGIEREFICKHPDLSQYTIAYRMN